MKKIFILIVVFAFVKVSSAQIHMGLHSDNYAGIYNINFQPADIVDGRLRFDMNIFQTEFNLTNNYIGLKKQALFPADPVPNGVSFKDYFLNERINGRVKKVSMESNTMLPFSFFFQFGKNMKNAFAFNSRLRINTSVGGVDEKLAQQIYSGLKIKDLYNVGIENKNLSIQTAAWAEVGLTYGREIIDLGDHYVKGAFTGKMNQGAASVSVFSDNLDITFPSDSNVSINNSDLNYDISTNILDFSNSISPQFDFKLNPSFSADFGFVYEWRPNIDKYKYELDGNPDYLNPKKNKYKLKASVAFTDIGFLKFQRSPHSKTLQANFSAISTEELGRLIEDFGQDGLASIDSAFNNSPNFLGTSKNNPGNNYLMRLPFRINAMVDYRIWKGFYVSATASIAPNFKKDETKSTGLSQFSITPRYEIKEFGAQIPLSIDGMGRAHVGLGLRLGPLVLGMSDIIPLIASKNYNIQGVNFYFGARIPVFTRIKDRDKDHVSNKKDNCKREKGTWETLGCPDTDKDGITDDKDDCPEVPGTAAMNGCPDLDSDLDGIPNSKDECPEIGGILKFNGCPDTDEDGIKDSEDKCPEIAGIIAFNGCPDTDGDGVKDSEDDCPEIAGIIAFGGCPDTDEDGVKDSEDDCPTIAGLIANNGCPKEEPKDKDGDGVLDINDSCPEIAGPAENKGCPYADTDNDGTIDKEDECIQTPGPKENKGCPVIKEEVKEAIKTAFDNLQFVSGKAIIKTISFSSLERLANIMKENPSFNLKIAGHTDSVGAESNNMKLSESRANAVKTYLMQNGIAQDKFMIEAYGETRPIGDNNTEAGRQMNRRVEMEVIQK